MSPTPLHNSHVSEAATVCECSCMSEWMNKHETACAEYLVMCLCCSQYLVGIFYFLLFHHITEATASVF